MNLGVIGQISEKTVVMNERPQGQRDALKLACEPLDVVRIGLIGLGFRGLRALKRFVHLEGVEVVALCDISPSHVERFQAVLSESDKLKATEYSGDGSWTQLCEQKNVDLVYICTDWFSHAPMAVYAMEQGKHVAIEVPAATTVEDCWHLVNTAETTRRHCMMLENTCYDPFELATLNMAQQGLFGELIHGEGAYIHDLRPRNFISNPSENYFHWQNSHAIKHTGNPYPTHGLGPICQVMDMHRGDKMNTLVSMSSKQAGMTDYATKLYGEDSREANMNYRLGDMNTTLIKTERGRTIMLQYNTSTPRIYTRIHLISGTNGFFQKFPIEQIALVDEKDITVELKLENLKTEEFLEKYKHPFIEKYWDKAVEVCGERARDYIMDSRLIHCLRNGLPLDQDVYDAAEWSCIVQLSEQSVINGSVPVEIPDFTRGAWKELKGLTFSE